MGPWAPGVRMWQSVAWQAPINVNVDLTMEMASGLATCLQAELAEQAAMTSCDSR